MAKSMKIIALISLSLTMIFTLFYFLTFNKVILSLLISFITISYHFIMRLIVGGIINKIFKNNVNYKLKWFTVSEKEIRFYEKLKVKSWKEKLPTYSKETFDISKRTIEEILGATCQAEMVHEIIMVLSFLPIILSVWFNDLLVFIITSTLSALFDGLFVIIQRYNRPRLIKILNKIKK